MNDKYRWNFSLEVPFFIGSPFVGGGFPGTDDAAYLAVGSMFCVGPCMRHHYDYIAYQADGVLHFVNQQDVG